MELPVKDDATDSSALSHELRQGAQGTLSMRAGDSCSFCMGGATSTRAGKGAVLARHAR
jgi:hypothetical protein